MRSADDTERIAKMEATLDLVAEGLRMLSHRVNDVASLAQTVARIQERQDHHAAAIDDLRARASVLEQEAPKIREKVTALVSFNRGFAATIASVSLVLGWLVVHQINAYEDQMKSTREQLLTLDRRAAWVDYLVREKAAARPQSDKESGG